MPSHRAHREDIVELTVNTFLSVDGVLQGPGGPGEDTSGGSIGGSWLVPYADADMGRSCMNWFEVDAFLLGRRTCEIFASYWPNVTDPDDIVPTKLNIRSTCPAARSASGPGRTQRCCPAIWPIRSANSRPKDGGELQVHGSGALARSLYEAGLIDELELLVFPVCVGTGKRLFGDGDRRRVSRWSIRGRPQPVAIYSGPDPSAVPNKRGRRR